MLVILVLATPTRASAAGEATPIWSPLGISAPTNLPPGGSGTLVLYLQNVGGAASSGTITLEDQLPAGLFPAGPAEGEGWSCSPAVAGLVSCTTSQVVAPGTVATQVRIPVGVGAAGTETNVISVVGGGGMQVTEDENVTISAVPAEPGIQVFHGSFYEGDGEAATAAGSHPETGAFAFFVNTVTSPAGVVVPAGEIRRVAVDLPPGLLVNSNAVPRCPAGVGSSECPPDTQVGSVGAVTSLAFEAKTSPLHAQVPSFGYPAAFTFEQAETNIPAVGLLRATTPYAPAIEIRDAPQIKTIFGVFIGLSGAPGVPLMTMPTACSPQSPQVTLRIETWQGRRIDQRVALLPPLTGCERLKAAADLAVEPARAEADSPAAFGAVLSGSVEGLTDPEALGPAAIEDVVAELPQGVVVNPAVADGLGACSEAEVGLDEEGASSCPDASKVGTLEVKTALLPDPLPGTVYLAAPGDGNPFGSLLALYLVVDDPQTGVVLKLPARVALDERTGRVTVALDDLPQLPIESLRLRFRGGARALLATPTTCGSFAVDGTATPWSAPHSGPPIAVGDGLLVDSGAGGSSCARAPAERPFAVGGVAGADTPVAGSGSAFELRVSRPDGSQELESLELALPPGISAGLRGIARCPEAAVAAAAGREATAERSDPSCPAASQVGTTLTGAGSGPSPFHLPGRLYLAGPYRGAPLSLVSVTPAIAGPFDLGTLAVRTALEVDPVTARITARTDPLPRFLEGVALRLRDLGMRFDRPGFIRNPTSCEPSAVRMTVHGDSGAVAELSTRFQVGGCEGLGFKPQLSLRLSGAPPRRGGHPEMRAVLRARAGDAGIRRAAIVLPETELLENAHIRGVCPRPLFAAGTCPGRSVYGTATVWSPLLDEPLRGPVYLRASERRLPDLVAALNGQFRIDLIAQVDSIRGRVRTTFEGLPDMPVSRLALTLDGGSRGLLVNNTRLCRARPRAGAFFRAHNDKAHRLATAVRVSGCGGAQPGRR